MSPTMTTPADTTASHDLTLRRPEPVAGRAEPAGPAPTCIRAAGFDGWYGEFQALKGISLEIPRCRVTAFIGDRKSVV